LEIFHRYRLKRILEVFILTLKNATTFTQDKQEVFMQSVPYAGTQTQVRVNSFIRSVYNWMAGALALTGFTAFYVANSPQILGLLFNVVGNRLQPTMLFWGCLIGELVLVFTLSARVQKMKAQTATALFIGYSVLNGVTLSSIFLVYTQSSITSVFFICAATFVATSLFGYFTKKDLTSMGQFCSWGWSASSLLLSSIYSSKAQACR